MQPGQSVGSYGEVVDKSGKPILGRYGELVSVDGKPILGPKGELLGFDRKPICGMMGELLGPARLDIANNNSVVLKVPKGFFWIGHIFLIQI